MKKVTLMVIFWRLLLFIPVFFIKYIPKPQDLRYFGISPWANFDGDHYLAMAMHGIDASVARFFPLYPMIVKLLVNPFTWMPNPTYTFFVAMLVSNFAFLGACLMLYKLLRIDYSHSIAFWTIFFLLLFPTSFFFGSVYAESIFLLLLVLSFYFSRKRKRFFSIVAAMLLSITRSVGIAILPALFFEGVPLYSVVFIPVLLVGYAYYNFVKFGDWLYFVHAQTQLANGRTAGFIFFPQTIFRYIKILFTVSPTQYAWSIALLEIAVFIFASVLLYIAYIKKVRPSYLVFAVLAFLIPASTGTFSGLPRYILVLFPMFIALALIKNKMIKIVYIAISTILSVVLLMLFARGYYVA